MYQIPAGLAVDSQLAARSVDLNTLVWFAELVPVSDLVLGLGLELVPDPGL